MIKVDNVSMKFRINSDRVQSLKEFVVAAASRRLKYKEFAVFSDVSFTVEKGEVVGIIGRNGAGKSTLLKIIAGILSPTAGTVELGGKVVPMLELGSGFDQELTGRENIFLNGAILGYKEEFLNSRYEEILEFSGLGDFIESPIRNYSSGMMMRLAFSIATVVQPEILIVDEILAVGDEAFQRKSKRKMLELMGGGTTVLFVSHSIAQIREMCSRVIWLENGKVKMEGETKYVCDQYQEYLNPPGKERNKMYKPSDAARNLSDVLFIYGDDEKAYEWRVTYQREQLVAAAVPTNEIYEQDLSKEVAKLYRVFVCVRCSDTLQMREFLACAAEWNKTVLFDFSLCTDAPFRDDPQIRLLEQVKELCSGVIVSNEELAKRYRKAGYQVFCNPLAVEEEILKYAAWAVYDREVLPFCKTECLSEEELVNYNRALSKHKQRLKNGKRIGIFDCKCADNVLYELIPGHLELTFLVESKEVFSEKRWSEWKEQVLICPVTCKADRIRNYSEVDLVLLTGEEGREELLLQQWIYASLVKVPCYVYMKSACIIKGLESGRNILFYSQQERFEKELLKTIFDKELLERVAEKAYQDAMAYHTSVYTGDRFGQYVRKCMNGNIVFLVSDLAFAGTGWIACHHAVLMKKQGFDVLLVTTGKDCKNIRFDHVLLPAVSRDVVYSYQFFDSIVAFDWKSAQWMQNYSGADTRYYYVPGFETDYYLPGNIMRLQANQMYTPHVKIHYVTASLWCKRWLKEKYGQDAVLIHNGIAYGQFENRSEKFASQKIRILIIGNSETQADNLSEAFEITGLLNRERYKICFFRYGGHEMMHHAYDKLYCCQSQQEVWEMYGQCDILLVTGRNICFQTAPLEMMAAAGAVVIKEDVSNARYLKADENCSVYRAGDVQEALARIDRISRDDAYREKLIKNGLHTAQNYDWKYTDEEIRCLYMRR